MNMNTSSSERPPWADPTLDAYERSGFVVFAEYCSHLVPEPKEIADLVGSRWLLKPSLFHLSTNVATQLGSALSFDQAAWSRALGQDLLDGASAKAALLGELRHCRTCLSRGWHSAVFQHPAVHACPLHAEPLRCGCEHCGAPIQTSAFAIARNHMHCGVCGKSLAFDRRRMSPGGHILQVPREAFEPLRLGLVAGTLSGKGMRSEFRWEIAPEEVARSANDSKAVAFHRLWPREPIPGVRKFHELRRTFGPAGQPLSQSEVNRRARAAAIETLTGIAAALESNDCLEAAPGELSTNAGSAARLDVEISLVSAAFWRTATAFRVLRQVRGELPPPDARVPPFGDGLPNTPGAVEAIVTGQVYGLLAQNLLELRHLKYAAEVAWNQVSRTSRFCPAWTSRIEMGRAEFHVRLWATDKVVSRLMKRYSSHRLLRVPDELRVLDVVAGNVSECATSHNEGEQRQRQ